jgi:hypothetical protein
LYFSENPLSDAKRITHLERDVAKLRKEFEQFRDSRRISHPRQDNHAPVSKEANTQQQEEPASITVPEEHATTDTNDSQQATDNPFPWWSRAWRIVIRVVKWPRWKACIEFLALIGGIVYAAVTVAQWKDLRHNFQTDERSWVNPTFKGMFPVNPNTPFDGKAHIYFTNDGKSPILRVVTDTWVEVLKVSDTPTS